MTDHKVGTRAEWLAPRLELLEAEKELTRRRTIWCGGDRRCPGFESRRNTGSTPTARRRPWIRRHDEYDSQ
jgi:predicted dithiol-disulfide oxidoreductase (DUF899 family)